ncbi:MAG: hypothetical protein B6244_12705 [Candidatus Cloacimonetes bacterium 4572_55]|nr:MAG: hypothetical protein B6244_12705 [Candidatus Cloacimonetes bacterium 4572_55]
MTSKYPQIDIDKVTTIPISRRQNKVNPSHFARVPERDFSIDHFIDCLPSQLAATDFRSLLKHIHQAKSKHKPIIWMMGAHVIKVGLSRLIIKLMQRGFVTALAMNGAGAIHDAELATGSGTSEDVEKNLADGTFGMARETGRFLNNAATVARDLKLGFGESVGRELCKLAKTTTHVSLFANAYRLDIPATLHVAIGTDIIHQQPTADGAALGDASYRDFKIFAQVVSGLGNGGVVLNIGSNVLLPEVFLKALTVARNVGGSVSDFTTANFDMIQHYRPRVNVVQRPIKTGGQGYNFIGHHELMIPLLTWSLLGKQTSEPE